ncbi:MAG: GrpB family protein [Halobaculum sp.]
MTLEPDPVWTDRYERERERIERHTDPLAVFHAGSTAIPDLAGKPELDVIAVYEDLAAVRAAADALVAGDRWSRTDTEEMVVVYHRDPPEGVFLKLHARGDRGMLDQIVFRDYLRENERARREYERVKREAAAEHDAFQPYQEAKADTVRRLVDEAREAGYVENLPRTIRDQS